MRRSVILIAAGFLCGTLTGALAVGGLRPPPAHPELPQPTPMAATTAAPPPNAPLAAAPPPSPPVQADALTAMEGRLAALAATGTRLEAQIQGLQRRLAGLEQRVAGLPADPTPKERPRATTAAERREALVRAGVVPPLAEELIARSEQLELARLDLRDQAMREGWHNNDRYREELARIDGEVPDLRGELGDDTYDRYLYAAGQENRVRVAGVIPGSAADASGLAAGDLIESYAGDRVYTYADLRTATAAGERGELVAIQLRRADGTRAQVWVPRGPLGVRLDLIQMDPDA